MKENKKSLNKEILESITGGIGNNEDPQAYGHCKKCTGLLQKTSYGYYCNSCKTSYDNQMIPLDNKN